MRTVKICLVLSSLAIVSAVAAQTPEKSESKLESLLMSDTVHIRSPEGTAPMTSNNPLVAKLQAQQDAVTATKKALKAQGYVVKTVRGRVQLFKLVPVN